MARLADRTDQFERGFGAMADVEFEPGLDELDRRLDEAFRGTG